MSIPRGRLLGGVASFAHLAGIGLGLAPAAKPVKVEAVKPKADDGGKPDDAKPDEDGEDTQAAGSGDDTQPSGAADDTQPGGAADDDAKPDDQDDSDEDSDPDADDDEAEMHGKSAAARARRRERARCAAIFASRSAAADPVLAANLAFNSSMPRQEALKVLEGSRKPGASAGADRASRNPALGPGGERSGGSSQAVASSWDRAFANVPGRPLPK